IVSTTSGRSLLSKVTEYGRNAVITNGIVKSGTKLPSYQFTYKHDVFDQKKVSIPYRNIPHNLTSTKVTDLNGDHIDDLIGRIKHRVTYRSDDVTRHSSSSSSSLPQGARYWLYIKRSGASKKPQIKATYAYSITTCTERGSGEGPDLCSTKSASTTEGGLYADTTRIADFDGDGFDDIITDHRQVMSRAEDQKWSNVKGLLIADFNGDGRADLGDIDPQKRDIDIRLSNGTSGFISKFTTPKFYGALYGDYNGDGLTDVLYSKSGHKRQIYYSTGLRLAAGPIVHYSAFGDIHSNGRLVADANGDGRSDYIGNRKQDHTRLYLSRGDTLLQYHTEGHGDLIRDYPTAFMADIDGDGINEFVTHRKKVTSGFDGRATKLISERPDMLVGVVLPSGGQLSASYTTYGGDPEDERWFPPVLTVLASLTEKPNSSQAFTTRFAYSGGRWDFDNRRFAGFKKIITTLPKLAGETKAPTVETTYRQDVSSVGKIAQRIWKDGNGTILRKQVEEYSTDNSKLPYTSLNTASLSYTYDEGVERVQKTTRIFNSYGQAKYRTNHGDTAKSGDERTYTRWSYPNKDKYIINKWAVEAI
ncbi:Insecticide toxin TcdB middle/N-terminal region, partial [Pseudovibrio denitrificans]